MDERKINTPTNETIITSDDIPESTGTRPDLRIVRGQIEVPPRVTEALAEAATNREVLLAERQAEAAETSRGIYNGAQEAGIDIGEPLYGENGTLTSEPVPPANSQAGLAAHR